MSQEHVESMLDDLLTDDERGDLARVIGAARERWFAAVDATDVQHQLESVYLEGRLSGLCREGALELVTDALSAMGIGPAATPRRSSETVAKDC